MSKPSVDSDLKSKVDTKKQNLLPYLIFVQFDEVQDQPTIFGVFSKRGSTSLQQTYGAINKVRVEVRMATKHMLHHCQQILIQLYV